MKIALVKDKLYTNKELAVWFGISASTFSKNKDKKLEELKRFADYELIGEKTKKVKINEVFIPYYSKSGSIAYQAVRNEIDSSWNKDGLDSCARVKYEVKKKLPAEIKISDSTIYDYTIKGRNELYGRPFMEAGLLGKCEYIWCKKEGEEGDAKYSLFTPEEKQIKDELVKKYFGNTTEKQIIVKKMVSDGEISREEAWGILEELTNMKDGNFLAFLGELQAKLGCQVVKGTWVERYGEKKLVEEKYDWEVTE